ncbi:hypothetical protein Phum_PHUM279880 [Pediculus humanus corporis]|uniref:Uncharacterized protein n=1 Tax=Pediculus humanus subsp. corporis TaxID=121224 RepID=E0VL25_PEDHC|nr:uncharacterized protein Phum_PHUM279880 [Pediculus humanus corporis]EEB14081.1 hypothetical protein Phum_PHUM279880 [Pediculus humanus corporis]
MGIPLQLTTKNQPIKFGFDKIKFIDDETVMADKPEIIPMHPKNDCDEISDTDGTKQHEAVSR